MTRTITTRGETFTIIGADESPDGVEGVPLTIGEVTAMHAARPLSEAMVHAIAEIKRVFPGAEVTSCRRLNK